jgi:hypothetical protein
MSSSIQVVVEANRPALGLLEFDWVEGENLAIDWRFMTGDLGAAAEEIEHGLALGDRLRAWQLIAYGLRKSALGSTS